ncbi:3-oxo-tetronate kinase [Streptomyces lonarensis]|uniref:3-oxo-tetronate kinase n=3 Tax=Streptomyces lonarensis TaxID=700599 RepID=A0A7X6HYM7_9ACTN|nr:3-oxo-tetronate kinase [Streptomyces lonarensis]NJQ05743.1 four-carbon acid sugar kinase family protein [Streptomyces lonarensis]
MVRWGGVADDFTGATDLATNWVARGLRTSVTLGVPTDEQLDGLREMDAVVVALKSRTAPVAAAVDESVAALRALRRLGAERFYDKYCSTFDSTPEGNIGPIADALMAELDTDIAVVVPSFPATGRTVYQGHLFVGRQLLSDSSMRHHPLTPMTRSDVVELLAPQTGHAVRSVPLATVRAGADALRAALAEHRRAGSRTYVVVDALDEADLAVIAEATADHPLVTGGSGLALGLPAAPGGPATTAMPVAEGHRAVLAGSASSATRGQIADARGKLPTHKLDLAALRADLPAEVARITAWAGEHWAAKPGTPVLVYAVDSLDDIESAPPAGGRPAGELVEEALAGCATAFAAAGARQFLVAGGETSGSVVQALDIARLELGPRLAPGVSWAHGTAADGHGYNLALKSGNFGRPDIFTAGWQELR